MTPFHEVCERPLFSYQLPYIVPLASVVLVVSFSPRLSTITCLIKCCETTTTTGTVGTTQA